jgi:shikimate dehydrogenase
MSATNGAYHLGLIGWPLGHSLSPIMHTAALQAAGLTGDYRLFPIPPLPEGEILLANMLDNLRSDVMHGLNVTIPHKQNVLPFLDTFTPAARAIGAVNTIAWQNGQLKGDNTDWIGFSRDLAAHLPHDIVDNDRSALVLGAGGGARAVVYALWQSGWKINISSRRPEQAAKLAGEFSSSENPISTRPLPEFADLPSVRLIVNTTPAGMSPKTEFSPWPMEIPFPPKAFLYDLVYNPADTSLVKAARSAGLSAVSGLGMLAEQAALAFEIWTGCPIPGNIFRQAALERMPS